MGSFGKGIRLETLKTAESQSVDRPSAGQKIFGSSGQARSEFVKKIYVGNLPWSTTDEDLRELFATYGAVQSSAVVNDRETGRSRGFGFVEMEDADCAKAVAELDGRDYGGRALRVNEALDKRRGGGGGGGRDGGGGSGGGGGRW